MHRDKGPLSKPVTLLAIFCLTLALVSQTPIDARAIIRRSPDDIDRVGEGAALHREPHTPFIEPSPPAGGGKLQTRSHRRVRQFMKRGLFPFLHQDSLLDNEEDQSEIAGQPKATITEDQTDDYEDWSEESSWQERIRDENNVELDDDEIENDQAHNEDDESGQVYIEPLLHFQDLFASEEEDVFEDSEGILEAEDSDGQDSEDYDHLWQEYVHPSRVWTEKEFRRGGVDMVRERGRKFKSWIVDEWEDYMVKGTQDLEELMDWVDDFEHARTRATPTNTGVQDSFWRLLSTSF